MAYLLDNPNPSAPERANGVQFWGYPSRQSDPSLIVIHTAENAPYFRAGNDAGAEDVASYLSRVKRPASYHVLGDSDSTVRLLPDDYTAFGARGANANGLHFSFATQARLWPKASEEHPAWKRDALRLGAEVVAAWCRQYDIPVSYLAGGWEGQRGITGHDSVDPERRSDPGAHFPWRRFLRMVERALNGENDEHTSEDALYEVEEGDTLNAIAERFDVDVEDLVLVNGIDDPDLIITGEELTIPVGDVVDPDPPPQAEESGGSDDLEAIVDSYPLVAKGRNAPADDIKRAQALLASRNHPPKRSFDARGRPDGIVGGYTDQAIRAFQREQGLTVDGIVGPQTWNALLQ